MTSDLYDAGYAAAKTGIFKMPHRKVGRADYVAGFNAYFKEADELWKRQKERAEQLYYQDSKA